MDKYFCDPICNFPITMRADGLMNRLSSMFSRDFEDWLSRIMATKLEPDTFIRAYGNDDCKRRVAKEIETLGWQLVQFPDRKVELRQHDKTVATYDSP